MDRFRTLPVYNYFDTSVPGFVKCNYHLLINAERASANPQKEIRKRCRSLLTNV
jgi:hypothetical protein